MKRAIKKVLKAFVVCSIVCGLPVLQSETSIVYAQTATKPLTIEEVLSQSNMTSSQKAFIRLIYPHVKVASEKYGILQSVTLAQAILESNWGQSDLGIAPHHNLFGIKASADWLGTVYEKETREYIDGKVTLVKQPFRSYSSYEEGILDYGKFFTSTPWRTKNYEIFLKSKNYVDATNALQKAGYASTPIYATSLQNVIETYKLNKLDPQYVADSQSDSTPIDTYTGLKLNASNELVYFEKGVFKNTMTGLIPHENKHYYVVNGRWALAYTGLVTNAAGTYYVKQGIIDRSFTGFVWHNNNHYYMVNGRWAPTYTGLGTNPAGTYYVKQGVIDRSFTGFVWHNNKHYYMVNGRWAPTYTGLGTNPAGTFYVKQGIIDRTFIGFVWHNNKHYYILHGRWVPTYTGLGTNPAGTFYVLNGIIDRSYTGLVSHDAVNYYIVNGKWASTYTGTVISHNLKVNVVDGKVEDNRTGVFTSNNKKYYFINGKIATHYTGYYLENGIAYNIQQGIVIEQAETDLSKVVFIDPGHGGIDGGAIYYGLKEKDLVLDVSKKLSTALQAQGYNVILSREGDQAIDFRTERSRMVNETNSDIFISVHFNASGRGAGSSANGIETYWYEYNSAYQPKINQEMHNDPLRLQRSELLAEAIHQAVLQESGAADRRVRRDTFAVLRETAKPAALIELGFMDNYEESEKIRLESYRQRLADGLFKGIQKYYNDLIASYFDK